MKKRNILSVIFLIVFVSITLYMFTFKGSNQGVSFDEENYSEALDNISIHNLHINANVNKDNSIYITEIFDVTFNKSGLTEVVRVVPYKTIVYRDINGKVKEEVTASKITNIEVEGAYSTFYSDEITGTVTIGLKNTASYELGATETFSISYLYQMGKDYNRDYDDVYFNIVGTNSTLTIRDVSFMIELPEDVEAENIKMYVGKDGSTTNLAFEHSGNILVGSVDKLGPTEGITFRAIYNDGYLSYAGEFGTLEIVSVVLTCLMIGAAVLYFVKIRQRVKVVEPVELTIPKGITPFNAEYYDSYDCSDKSIIATIVHLASKGYLQINEAKGNKIELIKKKDILDSEPNSLKAVFNALFKGKSKVSLDQLDTDFSVSANAIKESEKIKTEFELFDQKTKKIGRIIKGLCFIGLIFFVSVLILANVQFFGFSANFYNNRLLMFSIAILVYSVMFMSTKKAGINRYLMLSVILFMIFYLYFGLGFKYIDSNFTYLICLTLSLISSCLIQGDSRYSQVGAKQKGLALGFKNFIKLCEVDQIKAFAENNPSYYYDVLLYAYVYNLSDVWIKKFETINLTVPEWISSDVSIISDYVAFNLLFNNFTTRTSYIYRQLNAKHLQAQYSSSSGSSFGSRSGRSGGSFGGGGFSGGGRGGGGFGAR